MERYPFLRFATTVLRVIGWIVLIGGAIGSLVFGIVTGGLTGAFMAVAGIIGSFLAWLFLLATREIFYLLIQVEENTRNTAERITIK
jgi:membrane associated rhomboid family serine protease